MEDITKLSTLSTSHLELQKKFRELQWNTDLLEQTHAELLAVRHDLCNTETLLENERRVSNELRMQLKAAVDVVNRLEEDQTKNQIERIQLQINCDAALKERNSLIKQTKSAKIESIKYKIKHQILEESIRQKDTLSKEFEQTITELKNGGLRVITTIENNIAKLKKEQQLLRQSCESVINFNKRLQTVGLCAHAMHQKDKMEIQYLRNKLASLSTHNLKSSNLGTESN